MMRAVYGLGIADAVLLLTLLKSDADWASSFLVVIFPILIFTTLASRIRNKRFRLGTLLLEAAYSIIAAIVIAWTFGYEHDAGYQIALLFIPLTGVMMVLVAGAAAFSIKWEVVCVEQSD